MVSCMGPSTVVKESEVKGKRLTPEFFKGHYAEIQKRLKEDKKLLKNAKKPEESLEWYLDAGSIARYAYDLDTSFKIWDFADRQININEQKLLAERVWRRRPPCWSTIWLRIIGHPSTRGFS